jgi:hypothetical protein
MFGCPLKFILEISRIFYILGTRRNVVHSDHSFATTMRLMSKSTNFTTSSVLVVHVQVYAYATTEKVEPNSTCRCNHNL